MPMPMSERILVINPNASLSCTRGIAAALAPLALPPGLRLEVTHLPEGPPAIASWEDWHSVALPLCRLVEREPAAAYVIACVSDPGLEAVRAATRRPVLGMFRCAVAAAITRAERFGIVGFVAASQARQRRALQAMGLEARLAAWEPLDLPMEVLTDPEAPRARIAAVARRLAAAGAEAIVLGCTGLAGHAAAAEDASGLPVIEPCRAAGAMALLAAAGGTAHGVPMTGAPQGAEV
ncbi:aspartate/glutamate racemase family protein [Paracraurococcus lichenis]|uniref:Aspartate/glutamate racemase family protein n=1 Tax=Paracraurococcus lichenis TaxID=3064888 RepID=A0ABT9DZE8_9PROT|nr:aspartate/glutamate racemase family protein [Paracraurococcus sp. LOR1-02]MDO9709292.1 aspartate/glutamate racemase family protein [Paracraurococcus sp. LOR1-02]